MHGNHYLRFVIMIVLSFVAMYALMYAMVDRFENVHPNLNQFYMAGLMAASMVVIELLVMWGMYPNKTLNAGLMIAGILALAGFFALIRQQTLISDREFLKSMIPHHGGAILMCNRAPIRDAKVQDLCRQIILGQQKEIEQMNAMLREMKQ